MTLKEAYARHPLARAVIRQLGGGQEALSSARDAASHGADGGFGGFCYYSETCSFTSRHRAKITDMAGEMAESLGEDVLSMVAKFKCLNDAKSSHVAMALYGGKPRGKDNEDGVMLVENALAWFALEEVGRALEED